jgi:hypothetical protein
VTQVKSPRGGVFLPAANADLGLRWAERTGGPINFARFRTKPLLILMHKGNTLIRIIGWRGLTVRLISVRKRRKADACFDGLGSMWRAQYRYVANR